MSQPMVSVFGGSGAVPGDETWEAAVQAGRLLATAGLSVATGGYGGVMEAAALGAAGVGGQTIGFTAPELFPNRAGSNEHIGREIASATLTERIHNLVDRSVGFVVMPGSIGTLTELMVVWNNAFITRYSGHAAKPVVTVGHPWLDLVPHIAGELDTDGSLLRCHDNVETAVAELVAMIAQRPADKAP